MFRPKLQRLVVVPFLVYIADRFRTEKRNVVNHVCPTWRRRKNIKLSIIIYPRQITFLCEAVEPEIYPDINNTSLSDFKIPGIAILVPLSTEEFKRLTSHCEQTCLNFLEIARPTQSSTSVSLIT